VFPAVGGFNLWKFRTHISKLSVWVQATQTSCYWISSYESTLDTYIYAFITQLRSVSRSSFLKDILETERVLLCILLFFYHQLRE